MSGTANAFLQGVTRLESKTSGDLPSWVNSLRRSAFEWVGVHGFPTDKDVAWKYTRVAPILAIPFASAEPGVRRALSPSDVTALAGELGGPRLVFVNGYFVPELSALKSLPEGVRLGSLASVFAEEGEVLESLLWRRLRERPQAFMALNVALGEDGAFIRIPAHINVEEPIHLVFISDTGATPLVSHPLSVVFAGAGSRATIVETHVGIAGGIYLSNAVTELVLDEGAVVDHYKVQNEAESAFHFRVHGRAPGTRKPVLGALGRPRRRARPARGEGLARRPRGAGRAERPVPAARAADPRQPNDDRARRPPLHQP